jgi:hypothetical protein
MKAIFHPEAHQENHESILWSAVTCHRFGLRRLDAAA